MSSLHNPLLHDPRPKSIANCLGTNGFDVRKFTSYIGFRADEARQRITEAVSASYDDRDEDYSDFDDNDIPSSPPKKKRRAKKCVMARQTEDGELEIITPKQSNWYLLYVNNPMVEDERFQQKFRRRFRLPYENYVELVNDCRQQEIFERWMGSDCTGRESSPIELLILGAMRYLGRGWTFDDLEEATAISQDVHRVFFHKFIEFGSTTLYDRYVVYPTTYEEVKQHMAEFAMAGMHGACGSSDATHITSENCEYNLRNNHIGGKSSHTTRTFNVTVNHRRRILFSTRGGPGRWNDKTLVLFDDFVSGIRDGDILGDTEFELLERGRNGEIITVKYKGSYVIVDNGYLRWSVTVPPFKISNKQTEIRWSKWVESMRKDVECTFGIMKGRWRILKTGIRVEGVEAVDQVWLTCCALHNWLLEIDGLDKAWDGQGIPQSDWNGEMGDHDFEGLPEPMARIASTLDARNYDRSGMGAGSDVGIEERHPIDLDRITVATEVTPTAAGTVRVVNNLGLGYFRSKLVEHFDILWQRHEVKWPSRRARPSHLVE